MHLSPGGDVAATDGAPTLTDHIDVVQRSFLRAQCEGVCKSASLGFYKALRIAAFVVTGVAVPNIASVLKQEIARIARRELRSETTALKKASASYRSEIAALKRRVAEAERQLRVSAKNAPRAAPAANDESIPEGMRFSAKGLIGHRKRLGLSANELGLLLGVSGQTIYNWESGKARPNRKFLPTLVALRTVGKKETFAHLEQVKQAA